MAEILLFHHIQGLTPGVDGLKFVQRDLGWAQQHQAFFPAAPRLIMGRIRPCSCAQATAVS